MLLDVADRQGAAAAGVDVLHAQRPVVMHDGEGPAVAVFHPVGGGDGQSPVVAAGEHRVAGGADRAVGQPHLQAVPACAVGLLGEAVVAGSGVQCGDQVAGGGEHDAVSPGGAVGGPGGEQLGGGGGRVADVHPLLGEVVAEGRWVTDAQREGGGAFGQVAEVHDLGEGDHTGLLGQVAQDASAGHRRQLLVVADQPHGAAAVGDPVDDLGEVGGGGHPGFVDDHQAARADPFGPARHRVVPQGPGQFGQGVGVHVDLAAE